tara:strand:+ start:1046 stop:1204 length:159 start_codon:yes stop_codon:yes gene_type:complete
MMRKMILSLYCLSRAKILHQLGLNQEQLTFRHAGRGYRPTDVHGEVVKEVLG